MNDRAALLLAEELDLVDNFMWSNDYPHHEGSWPHSAASIERQMDTLSEDSREKILGLNAARVFKLAVPAGKV
jgi:predicted TIM-barrel fold metal-dependent hydrolase